MDLGIFNNLINSVKESNFMKNFMKELSDFIENNHTLDKTSQYSKYSKYWEHQKFLEDNLAAAIGISKWSADIRYRDELSEAVNNSILELSETEGVLYRKQFMPNGYADNPTYNIDKFENGKIEHLILSKDEVPKGFDNEDIIFQYKTDGTPKVRNDLKQKVVELASKSTESLKEQENKKALDYKQEGHIYKAVEDDGYIFLKDLTQKRDYVLEDIDFIVDCYQGDGMYQVIDGEYKKISEEIQ